MLPRLLNHELGLDTTAAALGRLGMTRELDLVGFAQLKHLLEATAQSLEHFLPLVEAAALSARYVARRPAWDRLAHGAGPQADAVEALAHVHDDAHDLAVAVLLVLERLADGGQHDLQPQVVDGHGALVFELEGPLSAVLILAIFPLRSDAFLEQMIVGLQRQL